MKRYDWGVRFLVLLPCLAGCGNSFAPVLPDESTDPIDADVYRLLARFAHISDPQIVDEESPARLVAVAGFSPSAWRPQEAYSLQLLDGTIRAVNKIHAAVSPIDFLILTGDAVDNAQWNELYWFIQTMDGGTIDPLSGPDDRPRRQRPDPLLDPHHPFEAQGLYQQNVHGPDPTIPWFVVFGNHEQFAVGVLPIVEDHAGRRVAPLPLQNRIGLFLPLELDPVGDLAWGPITPANPGPPHVINFPTRIPARGERRYFTKREFIEAHLASTSRPPGHGFDPAHPTRTCYSVSPVPGLRLIALNSSSPRFDVPTLPFHEGAISRSHRRFLEDELQAAEQRGETVILATHHPGESLNVGYGTSFTAQSLQNLLNDHPSVAVHLAGHWHANVVFDRGRYLEIVTGAIIDAPQQGRIVEIWKDDLTGDVQIRYRFFSHLDRIEPRDGRHADLFFDPYYPLRETAARLAGVALSSR